MIENIGERVRSVRRKKHLTLEDVGLALGIASNTVQGWETGRYYPSADNLYKLAKFLHVSIDYLLDNPIAYQGLTQEENDLLEIFNSLNDSGQNHMMLLARTIGATTSFKKNYAAPDSTIVA